MQILKNQSLRALNTFGVEAYTDYLAIINDIDSLESLIQSNIFNDQKHIILGGGSNVLFIEDFEGIVIKNEIKGIKVLQSYNDGVLLEVGAGEAWHNFVVNCVTNCYYGLENLALIPGSVGAAPVQNIGAYGVEQAQFLHSVKGFDLVTGEYKEYKKEECQFGYRNSIFKTELKNKFIITSVKYKLSRSENLNLSYKELRNEIEKQKSIHLNSQYLMNTVMMLRKRKLPDVTELGNAGSFFKNPVLKRADFNIIKNEYDDIPFFDAGDYVKVPAAWLIEKCSWKGKRIGDAGVYKNHALILVNYGTATGAEIYELSEMIRVSVIKQFGIALEPEVQIIRNDD